MPGFAPIAVKQWNVTDQQLLSLIQLAMLEPDNAGATWPSGLWSAAEVIQYVNDVVQQFLHETGINCAVGFITGQANQNRYDVPPLTIDVRRLAWRNGPDGTAYIELALADDTELDYGASATWPIDVAQVPTLYLNDLTPSQRIQVQPTPTDVGEMELTYTAIAVQANGSGIKLSIPDDWTPYIKWGVIGKMLAKDGQANDPDRALYATSRFHEGITLARILVNGTD